MPVFHRFGRPLLIFAALGLVLAACDSGPGTSSLEGDPPVLSDFSFDPHEVTSASEDEDLVTFDLSMRVAVAYDTGDLTEVAYLVRPPRAGAEPIARGTLDPADTPYFEKTVEVSIPRGDVGLYTVLVYAVGEGDVLSNDVRGNLRFLLAGEPPTIEDVVAPDSVYRPNDPEEARQVVLIAEVSDPDGLSNINRVQFWNAGNPGARIDMYDDGENGDESAGDGRYTRIVVITSDNAVGVTELRFQATDRAGLTSNIVERSILVLGE